MTVSFLPTCIFTEYFVRLRNGNILQCTAIGFMRIKIRAEHKKKAVIVDCVCAFVGSEIA